MDEARPCHLGQLPKEILLDIIDDFLDPVDVFFLAQTSRWLRRLVVPPGSQDEAALFVRRLTNDALGRDRGLPMYEQACRRLQFLAVRARRRPWTWVCEACIDLHSMAHSTSRSLQDTPASRAPGLGSDLKLAQRVEQRFYGNAHTSLFIRHSIFWSSAPGPCSLMHRHVQVALKCKRLLQEATPGRDIYERKRLRRERIWQRVYLRRVLATVRTEAPWYDKAGPPDGRGLFRSRVLWNQAWTPKIVPGLDGRLRFLVLGVYRIPGTGVTDCPCQTCRPAAGDPSLDSRPATSHLARLSTPSRRDNNRFWLCPHQKLNRRCLAKVCTNPATSVLARAIVEALRLPSLPSTGGEAGAEQTEPAQPQQAHTVCGSCPLCPMDFAVHTEDNHSTVVVQTWRDFGPEASPANNFWQAHLSGTCPYQARSFESYIAAQKAAPPWLAPLAAPLQAWEYDQDLFKSEADLPFSQHYSRAGLMKNKGSSGLMSAPHVCGSVRALYESVGDTGPEEEEEEEDEEEYI